MDDALLYGFASRQPLRAGIGRRNHVIRLSIDGTRRPGSFFADLERLRKTCGRRWNIPALDLLHVMCTLRAADRYYRSAGLFRNTRQLKLAVTVADERRWREIAETFRRTVFTLSGDRLTFEPVALRAMPRTARPPARSSLNELVESYHPDSVCLFSGGADSFAGAAHLLAIGRRPLLVAHAIGPINGRQQELFTSLRRRFPQLPEEALIQLRGYPASPRRGQPRPAWMWRQRDDLQRLRSMYFFSLAAILADAHEVDDIFMCENGVIGAAIVWSPNQDTPYNTRPAEPHYLRQMQTLLAAALDRPSLRIRNPFQYRTKGEVLRECASLGLLDALYRTVSCWRSGNRGIRNCGQCVPCMFRQLSFDEAGLTNPRDDVYTHAIPPRAWSRWSSPNLHRLRALRDYSARVMSAGGGMWLRAEEQAVADAIDSTCGPVNAAAVDARAQEDLDDAAAEKMAATIERFAQGIIRRLRRAN